IVPLYFAAERPVVWRGGPMIMVDDERMPLAPGEEPELRTVRFRTLGCYPLTGAIDSTASTLPELIQERLPARTFERQARCTEREQGITIDVAYRFFSTDTRKYIVADTPGHEQYTRNMVTGASTADCAVILVDARKGVLTQTRRHSYLVRLLGINHVAVAVNKMDLVDFSAERFREIERECGEFASQLGIDE